MVSYNPTFDQTEYARHRAERLYEQMTRSNWLSKIWSAWQGAPPSLRNMSSLSPSRHPDQLSESQSGKQVVPISQIAGSNNQGRVHDFDAAFRPLNGHSRNRWLSVAIARQTGRRLPPVELVRVDGSYFVTDGHHRISVAKALGLTEIEANVTVLEDAMPV